MIVSLFESSLWSNLLPQGGSQFSLGIVNCVPLALAHLPPIFDLFTPFNNDPLSLFQHIENEK